MIGEKKKCIGLIFGGYSNEHEVSISSAKTVFAEDIDTSCSLDSPPNINPIHFFFPPII